MPNVTVEISGELRFLAQATPDLPQDMRQQQVSVGLTREVTTRTEFDTFKSAIQAFKTKYPLLQIRVTYAETE